jgi:universal stress protein E
MKIKHILVDIDPTTDEQPALNRAVQLAKISGASIELFLVVHQSAIVFNTFLDENQLKKAKQSYIKSKQRWLNTYVDDLAKADIQVSSDVCWHTPVYEAIIDKALSCKADLVIKSTHKHSTINKIFFTPNDWQLLKTCPIPILLAKSCTNPDYKKIMAAIDPSQAHNKPESMDQTILQTTEAWAGLLDVQPSAVHCYDPGEVGFWSDLGVNPLGFESVAFNYPEYIEQFEKSRRDQFESLISKYPTISDNCMLVAGQPATELPALVDENKVDLLVMGTSYRSGLLGSTVEKILDVVNCDVLAVKCS